MATESVPSNIPPNHRSHVVRLAPSDTTDDPRGPFDAVWVTEPGSAVVIAGDSHALAVLPHCDVSDAHLLTNVTRLLKTGTTAVLWGRPSVISRA
jgi:hypothetical protein